MMRRLLLLLLLALCAAPAWADEARPLYVEVQEQPGHRYEVSWRMPAAFSARIAPALELPRDCTTAGRPRSWSDGLGNWQAARWTCRQSLQGRSLRIAYPFGNPNLATIFKSVRADGASTIAVSLPGELVLTLAGDAQGPQHTNILLDYGKLGVEHIWLGIDHLLFVSCLIWIAGRPKRIFATITGFTIAHSVTLVLAALELVRVPAQTIEVLIALSIVFLAVELAKGRRETITWRYPIAVSMSFGLLHGFGFAAVLKEIGLPQEGLLGALFAFNVGIELGQLAFALALISVTMLLIALTARLARRPSRPRDWTALPDGARLTIAYLVGTLATYWMFSRMA